MIKIMKDATWLAWKAYDEPEDIAKELKHRGFTNFEWIDNTQYDTQAICCTKKGQIFIIIRGTEFTNIRDWITNLDCSFKKTRWGDVHRGFYKDAYAISHTIYQYLSNHIINKAIFIGGHSQGAAVCTNLAMIMEDKYYFDLCFPIASPRTASKDAAKNFGDKAGRKIHRVVNNNDIVTRIPTRFMGFNHIKDAGLWYFKESKECVNEISFWADFKDRVSGQIKDIGHIGWDGLTDHKPEIYYNLVRGLNS